MSKENKESSEGNKPGAERPEVRAEKLFSLCHKSKTHGAQCCPPRHEQEAKPSLIIQSMTREFSRRPVPLRVHTNNANREWLFGVMLAHQRAIETGNGVLKNEPKASITRVQCAGRAAIVKHYHYKGVRFLLKTLFKAHPSRHSVRVSEAMGQRSVLTPEVFGLIEQRFAGVTLQSWLITEDISEAVEMDRYILRRFRRPCEFHVQRLFVSGFAGALRQMMSQGLRHRDLKTCNVLVIEEGDRWRFAFIDLDDVKILSRDQGATRREWVVALAQINSSTPKTVSWTDRLRFLDCFPEFQPFERRAFIAEIQRISRTRGRVYLSDSGPVVEEFV